MRVWQASELQSGATGEAAERDGDEGLLVEGQHHVHAQREPPVVLHVHVHVQALDTACAMSWSLFIEGL